MKKVLLLLLTLVVLASCCHHTPLIGISCGRSDSGASTLNAAYTDAVLRSGGVPVIFPTVSDAASAEALIASVDGIVFSGGPDVNPSYYGETVWNETVVVDTLRDVSDMLLAKAALASGKPVLAICRGAQLMNIVLGGSLYQDIPTQVDTLVAHSGARHRIGVEKGSVLYSLFGEDSLTVNSFHHQALKEVAPDIRVTAHAPDGIVEAYEYGNQVVAFQFHPEAMARTDDAWLAPFRDFIRKVQGK